MTGDRTEHAVQRIEAALARIARAADERPAAAPASGSPSPAVLALVEKHEALREAVAQALAEMDTVIRDLDA